MDPMGCTRLLCPWNSPDKKTGVGCRALLQGIFPTQGSNPYVSCISRPFFTTSATWEILWSSLNFLSGERKLKHAQLIWAFCPGWRIPILEHVSFICKRMCVIFSHWVFLLFPFLQSFSNLISAEKTVLEAPGQGKDRWVSLKPEFHLPPARWSWWKHNSHFSSSFLPPKGPHLFFLLCPL